MGEQLKCLLTLAEWEMMGEKISFSWLLDDIEMRRDVRGEQSRLWKMSNSESIIFSFQLRRMNEWMDIFFKLLFDYTSRNWI